MASSVEDDDLVETDDYYAWLGLGKEATREEINNAFRKMSRIYHPDKHLSDENKQKAEELFNKIKRAHEVLADPHKKAIYDTTGVKGLETEGWEIVARTKTPQEILEEYERLEREKEERRLQQRTNPKGTVSVGVDATDVFDRYDIFDSDDRSLPHVEINEMSLSQSVECPLTTKDTAVISGNLSSRNGTGSGSINLVLRRVLSHAGWAEVEMAAGNGAALVMRGFRTLWHRGYGTMSGTLQVTPRGYIRPGFNCMVAHQLDKNLQGRLTWSAGIQSAMNATVVWDREEHHLVLSFQLGVPSTFGVVHYARRFMQQDAKLKFTLRVSTFGTLFEYGCEKKITQFSYLSGSVAVGVPHGVSLKLRLNRGNQVFMFPIHLSESMSLSAIFYGTTLPIAVFFAVKYLIVNPYLAQQKEKDLQLKKEANIQRMVDKQREAKIAVELMKETVDRSYEVEEAKGGLVIRKALYGVLQGDASELQCVNVTLPLQSLVKDSQLVLPEGTQLAELPGFYDPCVGVEKSISITYEFRHQLHVATFIEKQRILIPKEEHKMNGTRVPGTSANSSTNS